jgi:hypothetical protein
LAALILSKSSSYQKQFIDSIQTSSKLQWHLHRNKKKNPQIHMETQ